MKSKPTKKKPLYFIHIPKTAGSYVTRKADNKHESAAPIANVLSGVHTYVVTKPGKKNPLYVGLNHRTAIALTTHLEFQQKYFTFSNVRNIYSWLVSWYWHVRKDPVHYDNELAQMGFRWYLQSLTDRDTLYPNRKFLFCQLFSDDGRFLPDWLNHTETIDNDLKALAEYRGVKFQARGEKINVRDTKKGEMGYKRRYYPYYTKPGIKLVQDTWGRELTLYGHEFEGNKSWGLRGKITQDTKDRLYYCWDTDNFFFRKTKKK